jgi:type IV pilus assembly protein PilB
MKELYKKPLGDILVSRGEITREQLNEALREQNKTLKKLGQTLVDLGFANEEQITQVRALQIDVDYFNLQDHHFDPDVVSLVTENVARTYKLIPVKQTSDKLIIAMSNPLDIEAIDIVQFGTKSRVEAVLATEWRIMEAINRQYGSSSSDDIQQFMDQAALDIEVEHASADEDESIDEVKRQSDAAPVVKLVNLLLTQAVREKASDIHVEPRRTNVDVRYRIDGELHMVRSIPKRLQAAVLSRIKIMSELDISERRLPQDGRISVRIDNRTVDLRVSTSPSFYGERIVLRVLDKAGGLRPLTSLGFSENDLHSFEGLIQRPHGIILVTGPTGSGKTTTLYAALNMLRSESRNIMTVEDPIEYELEGINQTNINPKIGLTFSLQLRSILRQDPDVVLLGEIRDTETADIAFRAALTGHLVLSTLHCNSAASAITRLIDMGVEPFLVSSAINGVTAQRLVRVLCQDCKEGYAPDALTKAMLGLPADSDATLYKPKGCTSCGGSGYKGRLTVCETMVMNDAIGRLAMAKANSTDVQQAALKAGMISMREDGTNKVLAGITTVEEVRRKIFYDGDVLAEAGV